MTKKNKEVARRFILEAVGDNDRQAWEQTVDADLIDHNPLPGQPAGRAGQEYAVGALREGFPDMVATVEQQIAEGDMVVVRGTVKGTHNGAFMGLAPTGISAEMDWIDIYRLEDGKIAEIWHVENMGSLMSQLGKPIGAEPS